MWLFTYERSVFQYTFFFLFRKELEFDTRRKTFYNINLGVGFLYLVLSSGPGFCYVFLDLKEDLEDITVCGA